MKLTRTDFISVFFGLIAFSAWYTWNERAKMGEPAENWLAVRNIAIPDFTAGENPIVIFDREQKKAANVKRNVDIHHAGNLATDPICSGRSVKGSGDGSTDVNVLFSDFVAGRCDPPEGQYVAQVSWIVTAQGYEPKRMTYVSNVFRVLPKGSLSYVPPEQVQQLERAQELLSNPKLLEQVQ